MDAATRPAERELPDHAYSGHDGVVAALPFDRQRPSESRNPLLANLGSLASAADPACLRVRAGVPSRGASWLRLSESRGLVGAGGAL